MQAKKEKKNVTTKNDISNTDHLTLKVTVH